MEGKRLTEFLQSLEKMKDAPIVRFFSQFFTEGSLSPLFTRFKAGLALRSPGALAKELILWAVLLALGTFLIDQAFYWTKPGQVERARGTWQSISTGVASFGVGVKALATRIKGAFIKRPEAPRGRR
jgi:hypothetical protein